MSLTVKWADGVAVECGDTKVIFDPQRYDPVYDKIFITHAHLDHAKGFDFQDHTKYSTEQTLDLVNVYRKKEIINWKPVWYGRKIKIDDLEIAVHNAGHILGSAQYEVISPEGNLVYTGDLNFKDTLITKAADLVPCDILVIEATFGSPEFVFPPQEQVSIEMIQWAVNAIKNGKIPTFQADSIGNAQILIRVFNNLTTIPVITHKGVTRINRVYEAHGKNLKYIDARSEEADEITSSGKCIFVTPKLSKGFSENPDFDVAYVSGWASRLRGKRKPFILSDHADFHQLLKYVKKSKPKLVLLCHGGRHNAIFANYINKKLGLRAHPLGLIPTTLVFKHEEERLLSCEKEILRTIQIPGFIYNKKWILREVSKGLKQFSPAEISEALVRLTKKGILTMTNKDGDFLKS